MGGVPETIDPEQPAMSGASKGAFGLAIGQFTIKPSCAMPASPPFLRPLGTCRVNRKLLSDNFAAFLAIGHR